MAHLTSELVDCIGSTEKPPARIVKVTVTAEVEGDEPITRTATGTTDGDPYRLASTMSHGVRDDVSQVLRDKIAY